MRGDRVRKYNRIIFIAEFPPKRANSNHHSTFVRCFYAFRRKRASVYVWITVLQLTNIPGKVNMQPLAKNKAGIWYLN